MSKLQDLVNGIASVDRRLQNGATNLAYKLNDFAGISNYRVSSFFFGASTALMTYYVVRQLYEVFTSPEQNLIPNPATFAYAGFGFYQIMKNIRLERRERQHSEQSGDAAAIDFKLWREKHLLFNFCSAKAFYLPFLLLDIIYFYPVNISYDLCIILGQYFREVDYLPPTKKNKVFDFVAHKLQAKTPALEFPA